MTTLRIFLQHDYLDGTDLEKNKKDKKKKKKKESDDEGEKGEKSKKPSGETAKKSVVEAESSLRQRKGDDVVTEQKNPETDKDDKEETKT